MITLLDTTYDIKDIDSVALRIYDFLKEHKTFLFFAQMGCGKTTLITSILKQMGVKENISSPTYSIMQQYNVDKNNIWHIDLYRIKNSLELEELGLYEIIANDICFIEWSEKISYINFSYIKIEIIKINDKTRQIKCYKINN